MKAHGTSRHSSENFDKWMVDNGLSYSSVASACGIPECSVREWGSQKEIPERFSSCLERLVESRKKSVTFLNGSVEEGLNFKLSLDDHSKLSRKALESGSSLEDLIARHLHSTL